MLAMVHYPEVQKKAQAEIDEVVGRDRMPTFEDRQNLPYLRAMVREVLRWRPPGPLGVPHKSSADDWYEGYFIPKGSVVITNVWAMNRDPAVFPDFDEFRPERFLDESAIPKDTHGQGHVTFGAGRRICVGMNVANNALFIDMASLLWAINIHNGAKELPSRTQTTDEGLIVYVFL
jgi:cytochrome P450